MCLCVPCKGHSRGGETDSDSRIACMCIGKLYVYKSNTSILVVFVYNCCHSLLIFLTKMSIKDCQFTICRFAKHFLYDFAYHVFCFYFFANWPMNTGYTAYSQCFWLGHTGDWSFSVSVDMTVVIIRMNDLFWWLPKFLEKFFLLFFLLWWWTFPLC